MASVFYYCTLSDVCSQIKHFYDTLCHFGACLIGQIPIHFKLYGKEHTGCSSKLCLLHSIEKKKKKKGLWVWNDIWVNK